MKERVSVIGIGRLGLSFALLLSEKGYDVVGCDVNEGYVSALQNKNFRSNEPGINEMLQKTTMTFTTDAMVPFNHADIVFVFVQTPSLDGGRYNHKYVDQIVAKIETNAIAQKTLVIGCTVMPRYCESIQKRLNKLSVRVIYNPEFIAQGSIIHGLKNSDIVLIGGGKPPALIELYSRIMNRQPPNFKYLTLTGAEIAKISINCFLAMKIAYANMIGEIINNSWEGESMNEILDAIGSDSRIGNKYLSYGFPPGGPCIPRDAAALNSYAYAVGVCTKFTHAIDLENDRHFQYLLNYHVSKNPDRNVPFVFSSLSYKAGVDILTHSYQLKLCMSLLMAGYKVDVPVDAKKMDMPEEFKDYCYNDKVTFGQNPQHGYRIN